MQKLSDVLDNKVFKNAKFNTLKAKLNNLENKILNASTLIHINQYSTYKQHLENKNGDVDIKKFQIQVA